MFQQGLTFDEQQGGNGGSAILVEKPVHRHPQAGYGACSVSGCICQAYSGNGPLCENCSHNYENHW